MARRKSDAGSSASGLISPEDLMAPMPLEASGNGYAENGGTGTGKRKGKRNGHDLEPAVAASLAKVLKLRGILRTKAGVKPVIANAIIVLREHEAWTDVLAKDLFRNAIILQHPPPWEADQREGWQPRDLTNNDLTETLVWLQRNHLMLHTPKAVVAAVDNVAQARAFHPVRDYLNGLAAWDGVERLRPLLTAMLGVLPGEDPLMHELAQEFVLRFMISAVARVMRPGCQADHVPVLVGPQSKGKSSAIRELCGEAFFSNSAFARVTDKDVLMALKSAWMHELPEIDRMLSTRGASEVKAFLTALHDHYRVPYGTVIEKHARECVFFGTTNKLEFLTDPTGNRRFWPLDVNGEIDLEGIKTHRDLFWAEAVARYRAGEKWWITNRRLLEAATVSQDQRRHENPWNDKVDAYVNGGSEHDRTIVYTVKSVDIFDHYRPGQEATNQALSQITTALKGLGFEKRKSRTVPNANGTASWAWVRIEPANAPREGVPPGPF